MRRPYRSDSGPAGPRINDRIRISPVRLIDAQGEVVGIVDLDDAKRRAYDAGLDLVEVAADVRPPVVRIMDYGKFKYEKAKQDRANKSKTTEMKEVRLGRSMKIDPHDVEIRLRQARQFLIEGHKVQIVQNFRGREIAHRDRGDDRMDDIIEKLSDVGRVEMSPRLNGRRMTMIIGPDRTKIEALKRREAAAKAAEESQKDEPGSPPAAPTGRPTGTPPAMSSGSPPSSAGGAQSGGASSSPSQASPRT